MKFRTKGWHEDRATIRQGTYPDGSPKLTILGRYGQILCDVTVPLTDMGETPPDGEVFIRDYGDTEGALHSLQAGGVIGRSERVIETGTHTRDPLLRRAVHQCKLLLTD